jgi:hypothetical protein
LVAVALFLSHTASAFVGGRVAKPFFDQPVLNSPYLAPSRHHALNPDGVPLDLPPFEGRRRCGYIAPVPKARKQKLQAGGEQKALDLGGEQAAAGQTYGVQSLGQKQLTLNQRVPGSSPGAPTID